MAGFEMAAFNTTLRITENNHEVADDPDHLAKRDPTDTEMTVEKALIISVLTTSNVFMLLGNGFSIFIILKCQSLRRHTYYWLVLNLAVLDLLNSMFVVPVNIVWEFYGNWPFSQLFCDIEIFCDLGFSTVAAYSTVLLSTDKYLYINKPFFYHTYVGPKVTATFILGTWVVWMTYSAVSVFGDVARSTKDYKYAFPLDNCNFVLRHVYAITSFFFVFFIPLIMLVFTSSRILCIARQHIRVINTNHRSSEAFMASPVVGHASKESNAAQPASSAPRKTEQGITKTASSVQRKNEHVLSVQKMPNGSSSSNHHELLTEESAPPTPETALPSRSNVTNHAQSISETTSQASLPSANESLLSGNKIFLIATIETTSRKQSVSPSTTDAFIESENERTGSEEDSIQNHHTVTSFESIVGTENSFTDSGIELTISKSASSNHLTVAKRSPPLRKTASDNLISVQSSQSKNSLVSPATAPVITWSESSSSQDGRQNNSIKRSSKNKASHNNTFRAFGTVILVVVVYIIMFAPYWIASVINLACLCIPPKVFEDYLAVFYFMHSLVNPYIYMATDRRYKKAIRHLLAKSKWWQRLRGRRVTPSIHVSSTN